MEMLKDVGRGETELEARLRKAVSFQDGLMIVREPGSGKFTMHLLPASTPWMLDCGITGVSVTIGNSVTGDGESVQNDVVVDLTPATIDASVCDTLAPRLAQVLQQAK